MYLKSLEVHGFKSFANKIVFEFHNGITGIVGPNGSGKSNVGDAVRWVLGEQSAKQLRGANMQDVIFSGTENRKPLGFAYVAITLDNSDHKLPVEYEEVKVARRVYRSGESEYLLNGTSCRLKDVQELFYDTGIGKEGYSLIGQGQIDKILSGKPEERRELFDEAAGIVKFKRRKKAAQKNLENERQNLVRINDILSELEKQVGPLEKQSETAKIYLKKKEELKKYDVNLFLLETGRIRKNLSETEEKLRIATEHLEETKTSYASSKKEYEEIELKSQQVEQQIELVRAVINDRMLERQKLEGDVNVLKEQMIAAKNIASQFEQRKQSMQQDIATHQLELKTAEEQYVEMQESLKQMNVSRTESSERLIEIQKTIQHYTEHIEQTKNEIIELLNEKATIQSKKQRFDTMLEQVQIRKAELNQKVLQIRSNEAEQNELIERYEQELKRFSEKIAELSEKQKVIEEKRLESRRKLEQLSQELLQNQENYHRAKSKLDSLINMTERYDGYGNAIRRVMEQKEKNPGLIGVVADIIKTEKKYETAIETALGGSIQNIVTDNETTAKQMIDYLKQNRFGRATFLPLTSMTGRSANINQEIRRETGVIGLASELVEKKEQFTNLIENLLGRTVVVDLMDHAIALARKFRYSLRIVTLDGELLNPGGSMTGGAFKNSSNLLGRRREIEEVQESVEKLKKSIVLLRQRQEKETELQTSLLKKENELKEQQQKELLNQNTARLNTNQAKLRKNEFLENVQVLKAEALEIESQINEIGYQKKKINEEVELTQNKVTELESIADDDLIRLNEEQAVEKQKSQEVSSQQIEYASLHQRCDSLSENVLRIKQEIKKLEADKANLKEQFEQANRETNGKQQMIDQLVRQSQTSADEQSSQEQKMTLLQEQKHKLLLDNKSFFEKREELSQQENRLDKECFRLQSQKEKLDETFEELMNYMWEEYELTINSALPLQDEDLNDSSELKKLISRMRNEIRTLGNINVNAIDEYKEISERFEFMNRQRNDLLEAEKTLMGIIAELDEGMRKQFQERFSQIQKEFDKAYKELFGGGKGTIELQDEEDDVLEAGIQINSQPPGKKLGNMMQLSGGEKALTAIALLFAIQNLKPSPFCLLDEIEAALDDSNVSRYANYLGKLTKNTQFIIITHRQGTMAAADRLYGITMQEKGISTLVSVNLIEDQLDQ